MTAGTPIGAAPRIPAAARYGVITTDISGLGEVRHLVGGTGAARWKQLVNGMHQPGGWGCVEYVELPPGASCGRHLHATREEIYYILSGTAVMSINGEETPVTAGEMITCPLGTIHGIGVPADAGQMMCFFVVEVLPAAAPPLCAPVVVAMPQQLQDCQGYRGGGHGQDIRAAVVDLTRYLTGPWRRFTLIEVPADDVLGPYQLAGGVTEVLFVVGGSAEIAAGDAAVKGGAGLCAATSLDAGVTVRNLDGGRPLLVISTEVAA
ncbi:MAG: cupin domain-containing protein [Streptosporangiaceae bacterium]